MLTFVSYQCTKDSKDAITSSSLPSAPCLRSLTHTRYTLQIVMVKESHPFFASPLAMVKQCILFVSAERQCSWIPTHDVTLLRAQSLLFHAAVLHAHGQTRLFLGSGLVSKSGLYIAIVRFHPLFDHFPSIALAFSSEVFEGQYLLIYFLLSPRLFPTM